MESTDIFYRQVDPTTGGLSRAAATARVFPNVSPDEAVAGLDRTVAQYFSVESEDNDSLEGVRFFFRHPATGDYRALMGAGESFDEDTFPQIAAGVLDSGTGIGATEFPVQLQGDESVFIPGGYLLIHDQVVTGQTVSESAKPGDSVTYSVGAWSLVSPTTDYTYPAGVFLGDGKVYTAQESSGFQFLALPGLAVTDEVIGTGDGNLTVALSTLAAPGHGVFAFAGYFPTVTATCGGTERTATVGADGVCTGYCSAGTLNLTTGAWTASITWTAPPDTGTDIVISYRTKPYTQAGSLYTVTTEDTATAAFLAGAVVSGVLTADIQATVDDITVTSTAGTYTTAGVTNYGALSDVYDIVFLTSTSIQATSRATGQVVGTGSISVDFDAVDPVTGRTLFTLYAANFGGTFAPGDTMEITTTAAAVRLNFRQLVTAGASDGDGVFIDGYMA